VRAKCFECAEPLYSCGYEETLPNGYNAALRWTKSMGKMPISTGFLGFSSEIGKFLPVFVHPTRANPRILAVFPEMRCARRVGWTKTAKIAYFRRKAKKPVEIGIFSIDFVHLKAAL